VSVAMAEPCSMPAIEHQNEPAVSGAGVGCSDTCGQRRQLADLYYNI
jgi:hypothetical protein